MVSKTTIRLANRKACFKADPKCIKTKNWEMSKFRHALFTISEQCKGLKKVEYKLDLKKETSVCTLYFKGEYVICTYDYKTSKVSTLTVGEGKIVSKMMDVNELPAYIKTVQPKMKLIVRKK